MKWIKFVEYAFLGISVLGLIYLIYTMMQGNAEPGVDVLLKWAYFSLAVCLIVALAFPIANLFTNPKSAGKTLIYVVCAVVIIGLCYLMSSAEPVVNSAGGYFDDATTLKISDTGLFTAYICLAAAVVVAIVSEVVASFKK